MQSFGGRPAHAPVAFKGEGAALAVGKFLRAPAIKHVVGPAALYLVLYCLFTWPLCLKFSTHFFGDTIDGPQNIWNLWWVNLAVRHPDLYPSIWRTPLLHWPYGTTLVGHTLNPFNGFVAAVLLEFLPLVTTYNVIVVMAFVLAGLTMYWLAFYVSNAYWASITAGVIFTFSSFHFMHAEGHLQLVSLEWIPLFLLSWHLLVTKPTAARGMFAAVVLWLVLLCDYYYFFYCVVAAILIVLWCMGVRRDPRLFFAREYWLPCTSFVVIAALLVGPIVWQLLLTNYRDPLIGSHDPSQFSLDLLALFIPGGHWRFNGLTRFFWSRLPGNLSESSAYLPLSVYAVLGYLWARRKTLEAHVRRALALWFALMAAFILLALGPALRVAGTVVWDKAMPYTILAGLLPFLALSGLPVRMMVMVTLAASVLSAMGFRELYGQFSQKTALVLVLLAVIVFESLPIPLAATRLEIPEYVTVLAGLPDAGGVLDEVAPSPSQLMYYQIGFMKPIAFGYISRVPTSVVKNDEMLAQAIGRRDYASLLNTYHIAYVVTRDMTVPPQPQVCVQAVYDSHEVRIYRLQAACSDG